MGKITDWIAAHSAGGPEYDRLEAAHPKMPKPRPETNKPPKETNR